MRKRGSVGVAGRARLVVVVGVLAVAAVDACGGDITGEVIDSSVGGTAVAPRVTGGILGVGGYWTAGKAGGPILAGRAGFAGAVPMGGTITAGRAGGMPRGGTMTAGKAGAAPLGGWAGRAGAAGKAGAAPLGGWAGRAGAAGMAPNVCALGYPCSTPGSACVSGSITCLCASGIWATCSITSNTGGTGGAAPTGVPTPNGFYTYGSYTGTVWGEPDTAGSTITLADDHLCASGTAVRVPYADAGPFDPGDAWGALLGWNLNEPILLDGVFPSPKPFLAALEKAGPSKPSAPSG